MHEVGTLSSAEETLRRLTIAEPSALRSFDAHRAEDATHGPLDERTEALIRIGALVALDAPESSYLGAVESALLAGATLDELVAVLHAVAGSVGSARVVSAAPRLAMAAGYDIEHAIEAI
jgi:alkylhydroperoxidase/carboxymuconolactone decarboxylase family protein YurZ